MSHTEGVLNPASVQHSFRCPPPDCGYRGVRTATFLDVLRRADGTLKEKTHDWYAADNQGNVWYSGEATATYDKHGKVESRQGSWESGVHDAVAGLIMPADPRPTDAYRQEFRKGHAEDQAWIVQRHAVVTVPYATFHGVVRSFEWTRLQPGGPVGKILRTRSGDRPRAGRGRRKRALRPRGGLPRLTVRTGLGELPTVEGHLAYWVADSV